MFRKVLLVIVIILLAVSPVFAQSDTPITYGNMVEGTITAPDTPATYTFEARVGDILNITALADDPGELNLALDLFDPAGNLVASNDDYYLQNPALLEQYLPGDSGTYQIAVRSESGTGGFLLFLEGETSLAPGDVIFEETFDNNDRNWETNTEDDSMLLSDVVDGEYVIRYGTDEIDYYWVVAPGFTDWSLAPIFETPYQVTVDVSDVESVDGSTDTYFLMVIFQVQANYQCYHMLSVYPNGDWVFFGCDYQPRERGTLNTPVDFEDGETHTIGVQVDDFRLNILVDDQAVSYPIDGLEYAQGSVGFGIGVTNYDSETPAEAEAHFDNVIVREME